MIDDIRFDLRTLDLRALTPSQVSDLKQQLIQRAHVQRAETVHAAIARCPDLTRRFWAVLKERVAAWRAVRPGSKSAAVLNAHACPAGS